MSLNNIKKMQSERGFTLVELLIVIVIIAILAAITIVAYNGITARAHKSAGQQAAQNVVNKAEAYNAENGSYPTAITVLTSAASNVSWNLPTNAVNPATPTANTPDNTVVMTQCPASGTPTGDKIGYWDPTASPAAVVYMYAGQSC